MKEEDEDEKEDGEAKDEGKAGGGGDDDDGGSVASKGGGGGGGKGEFSDPVEGSVHTMSLEGPEEHSVHLDDDKALDPEKHSQAVIEKRNARLEMRKKFEAQQFAKQQLALKARPSPFGKLTFALEVRSFSHWKNKCSKATRSS